ncbi:MAG: replication factor C small subunit [Thermoplasmata archaeon]|nr:replication factor C small subunit [Thermoplasmata archaeon]
MQEMWIEKYRPKTLDEVVGQKEIVERLKAYVNTKNIPHLIFAGPAGTGKTTCALAIARELYKENWQQNFKEFNASDERGIGVVRGKIKDFARTAPIGDAQYKIIFLDEADALTPDAQAALRRTMEKYTNICRFILSVNYSSKIIEPIQSRCAVFRFKPINEEDAKNYLKKIAEKEGLEITEDAFETILYIANGDLRKAINILQTGASISKKIDAEVIYHGAGLARPDTIKKMIEHAFRNEFIKARNILDDLLINQGISGVDIIKQIHRILFDLTIPDETKIRILDKIGEAEYRVNEGSNERIQLEYLLAQIALAGSKLR